MSEIIPTIVIETKNGPVRINQADYNPDKHKLHGIEEKKPVKGK